eukprot:GHVU01110156.1.p1 GENE.GHVU01110156.1~~GHVU01110156.1.p1  ORF type:complete len:332 (+),score=65.29 GHVU01110156.1:234-1229(+)
MARLAERKLGPWQLQAWAATQLRQTTWATAWAIHKEFGEKLQGWISRLESVSLPFNPVENVRTDVPEWVRSSHWRLGGLRPAERREPDHISPLQGTIEENEGGQQLQRGGGHQGNPCPQETFSTGESSKRRSPTRNGSEHGVDDDSSGSPKRKKSNGGKGKDIQNCADQLLAQAKKEQEEKAAAAKKAKEDKAAAAKKANEEKVAAIKTAEKETADAIKEAATAIRAKNRRQSDKRKDTDARATARKQVTTTEDTVLAEEDTVLAEEDTALVEEDTVVSEEDTVMSEEDTAVAATKVPNEDQWATVSSRDVYTIAFMSLDGIADRGAQGCK